MERQLVLNVFSNKIAMEMGLKIIEFANTKELVVGVEVCRLNHTVFLYLDEGLCADKHNWLKRKANTARHFEESSLAVKQDLADGGMSLSRTFHLDTSEYVAYGGAMPIMVKDAGMIGTITVTGLPDIEDHQLIVDALSDSCDFVDK